jgi:transcriptional regulator with XRE-family HTH domain
LFGRNGGSAGEAVPALYARAVDESLGRRIADLRAKLGLTQQELADRVGISRVAVSNLEAGMSDPGERTVALLAGLFKVDPFELVDGTGYPRAKADRLPVVVARYTEVELRLELLANDLAWMERSGVDTALLDAWQSRLLALLDASHDERERAALKDALARVRGAR